LLSVSYVTFSLAVLVSHWSEQNPTPLGSDNIIWLSNNLLSLDCPKKRRLLH